jgi:PiT family inorganic phosphate transporter
VHREQLVKRSIMFKVIAAWIVTVPVSALLAAAIYLMIRGALIG